MAIDVIPHTAQIGALGDRRFCTDIIRLPASDGIGSRSSNHCYAVSIDDTKKTQGRRTVSSGVAGQLNNIAWLK
jgi:hypothetical protein